MLGAHEARGSHLPLRVVYEDFQAFTDVNSISHIPTRGAEFSWCNGRRGVAITEKRLNRCLCNDAWMDFWSSSAWSALVRSHSDHSPLLMSMTKGGGLFQSHFKFHKIWLQNPDYRHLVKDIWSKPIVGCPMHVLTSKLKAVKAELKVWNKMIFGNVHMRVTTTRDDLEKGQQLIDTSGHSKTLLQQEAEAQIEFQQALACEEEFCREKSRLNWHCYGDRNTSFFHRVTKIRHASKSMSILKKGEEILEDQESIAQHVLQYYTSLYATNNDCVSNNLIGNVIPKLVSGPDNAMLTRLPFHDEIKQAVFGMNDDGAPGPDGFGGCFFQHF